VIDIKCPTGGAGGASTITQHFYTGEIKNLSLYVHATKNKFIYYLFIYFDYTG